MRWIEGGLHNDSLKGRMTKSTELNYAKWRLILIDNGFIFNVLMLLSNGYKLVDVAQQRDCSL